jgi:Domain of unknown function (DUF5916)/Carbohydrate family 9 binding domain-like
MFIHHFPKVTYFCAVLKLQFISRIAVYLLPLLLFVQLRAQTNSRSMDAYRTANAPNINGIDDDSCWRLVPEATDFIQQQPNPGNPSRLPTSVKLLYDDQAIYVLAKMKDTAPDSVLSQLGGRDDENTNADLFGIYLDTYRDRRNAFYFAVTAAGVQIDARVTIDKLDYSLNSVWYSKVTLNPEGWTVELKIPYYSLRFPNSAEQIWGLNFVRGIRRHREFSFWNNVDQNVQGLVNQFGDLKGLRNILSPLRLALLPYVSGYADNFQGKQSYSLNGGMDVKYGINESFTLDMTLIPDFGQTISDNLVLNLSPFEIKFDERRYFFTEGTELFNKNDLFYSRRIGAQPSGFGSVPGQLRTNEIILENPGLARLYNAMKISGRTPGNLGLGFLNAVSQPTSALLRDTITGETREIRTEELANYNVLIVEQIIGKNSYLGFLNTNVMRNGKARDANVSSVQFRLVEKKNVWGVEGFSDLSLVWPRAASSPVTGHRYYIRAGRISGKFQADLRYRVVSNTFDPTDMGFQERNNVISYGSTVKYNIFKPFRRFIRITSELNADYGQLYLPRNFTFFTLSGRIVATYRNFMTAGINWLAQPVLNNDYFEPRVPGRYMIYPRNFEGGGFISSDYRKVVALDLSGSYRIFLERNRTILRFTVAPRIRANDHLFFIIRNENEYKTDNVGFVSMFNDSIIMGVRNLRTITNTFNINYTFNSTMILTTRIRHYWSEARYTSFFALNESGKSSTTGFNRNSDITFNAFTVDMIFTWQFVPGSELSLVWKNSIVGGTQQLFSNYFEDVDYIFNQPQINSLSFKLIWFLEAQQVKAFAKKKHG